MPAGLQTSDPSGCPDRLGRGAHALAGAPSNGEADGSDRLAVCAVEESELPLKKNDWLAGAVLAFGAAAAAAEGHDAKPVVPAVQPDALLLQVMSEELTRAMSSLGTAAPAQLCGGGR